MGHGRPLAETPPGFSREEDSDSDEADERRTSEDGEGEGETSIDSVKRDSLPLIVSVMALAGLGEAGELRSAKALMLLQDSGAL